MQLTGNAIRRRRFSLLLTLNRREELSLDLLRLPADIFFRLLFPIGSQWNYIAYYLMKILNQRETLGAIFQMVIKILEVFSFQDPRCEQCAELNVSGVLIAFARFMVGRWSHRSFLFMPV